MTISNNAFAIWFVLILIIAPWWFAMSIAHYYKNKDKNKVVKEEDEFIDDIKMLKLEIEKQKLQKLELENQLKLQKLTKQNIKTKDIDLTGCFKEADY